MPWADHTVMATRNPIAPPHSHQLRFGLAGSSSACLILFKHIVGGEITAIDLAEIIVGDGIGRAVVNQLAEAQANDALTVLAGQVEKMQIDQRGDAQLAVDSHQVLA
jgi:hypothetical protein